MAYEVWCVPRLVGYPADYGYELHWGVTEMGRPNPTPLVATFATKEVAEAYQGEKVELGR